MTVVATQSGGLVDLIRPDPGTIDIRDIAHALAHLCRFNGHTRRFYSVAEHSVLVAREAMVRGASAETQMLALLHDAAEAYLGDVVRPLKALLGDAYDAPEGAVMLAVARRFGLARSLPDCALVDELDRRILEDERLALMPASTDCWDGCGPKLGVEIRCLLPEKAKRAFLDQYTLIERLRAAARPDAVAGAA